MYGCAEKGQSRVQWVGNRGGAPSFSPGILSPPQTSTLCLHCPFWALTRGERLLVLLPLEVHPLPLQRAGSALLLAVPGLVRNHLLLLLLLLDFFQGGVDLVLRAERGHNRVNEVEGARRGGREARRARGTQAG